MPRAGIVAAGKKIGRSKINCSGMVEATGFEPTTSWSRTASRQGKKRTNFPIGKHVAPMPAAPFPERLLRIRSGALVNLARLAVGRKRSEAQPAAQQKSRRQTWRQPFWSRRRDLNPRPLGPEPSALPSALRLVDLPVNYSIFWCRRQPFCLVLFHKIIFGTDFAAFYRRRAAKSSAFMPGAAAKATRPHFISQSKANILAIKRRVCYNKLPLIQNYVYGGNVYEQKRIFGKDRRRYRL